MRKSILSFILILLAYAAICQKPNVIVVFTDDQGYNDLGCYGSSTIKTPNLDKMASNGARFTNFYVTSSICSPSRAALLTGRLPARNGIGNVLVPGQNGLAQSEITIAEALKTKGYKTACFGKWHLGDDKEFLPTKQGFDTYLGIPYSNDMYIGSGQEFSTEAKFNENYDLEKAKADQEFVKQNLKKRDAIIRSTLKNKVPLFFNESIVEYPANQATLTERYFESAIDFIQKSDNQPFFIYLTPAMPHVPLYTTDKFKNKSKGGLYGDVVEEIDFYMGRLLDFLKNNNLDKNTLLIFTSDNGPWLEKKENAGSAFPHRGGKFTTYEGGVKVPCIMQWKGKIAPNIVINDLASTLDIMPTIAANTGTLPQNTTIDGFDITNVFDGKRKSKRQYLFYSTNKELTGVRDSEWKYLIRSGERNSSKESKPELYNLLEDKTESNNVIDQNPKVVSKMQQILEKMNESLR